MGVSFKTIIHIPKLGAGQHLFSILYFLIFKNLTDLQKVLEIKKNEKNTAILKIRKFNFNRRGVQLKYSI